MKKRDLKKIEKEARGLFKRLDEEILSISTDKDEETLIMDVKVKDPKSLIGKRGEVLDSIQRLLRIMTLKRLDERLYLQLDINGYKEKKSRYLRQVAQEVADKVSLNQKKASLLPMSSYERRIIHIELAGRADVETESKGREPNRKVVVKPT